MSSDPNAPPINPLPTAVILLALPIVLAELVLAAGAQGFVGGAEGVGWRLMALQEYAFFGPVFDLMLEAWQWPLEHVARFVTYPFVHVGFTHMIMVLVFLLALGKMVGEVFSSLAVFVIFFASAILGALIFALVTDDPSPLAGGYPAVYGLIGAFTFIMWVRIGAIGGPQHQAFYLIGVLLFIQLIFGLLFGTGQDWIAEVAGFCVGFAVSPLVSPGGLSRALERLRQR
ncbi:MAG: rhomboid family intramembrane serine protease [Pseudomonadota bacterium]